jgi:hypothetical protein
MGFHLLQTVLKSLKNVFVNQKPQKLEMFGKIPANANTFALMAISDIKQYFNDYRHFLVSQNITSNETIADSVKARFSINLTEDFMEMFENEAGIVLTETANDSAQHEFTLFRVKSNEMAEKTLHDWVESYAEATNTM